MAMSTDDKRFSKYRLMTPGPVPIPYGVLEVLAEPMIHHRTPQFQEILVSVQQKLQKSFLTKQPVLIHTATGSGAMESALVNTLNKKDKVLCIVSGKFGERWRDMCHAFGFQVIEIAVPWGDAVSLESVQKSFSINPDIKAVLCQACETSTGTQHPIQDLADYIRNNTKALFMVDAITAIGAMTLPMDEWGIDVMVSGSQKAFMLPTGISFISLSPKAWKAVETCKTPRFYFDLLLEKTAHEKQDTYYSAPVSMIKALNVSLDLLVEANLEKAILRSHKLAKVTRMAGEAMGLKVFSKAPSPSVTALLLPEDIDSQKVREEMESKYNVTVMGGQDQLKGRILRIGHLGWIQNEDLEVCIEAMGRAIINVGPKSSLKLTEAKIVNTIRLVREQLEMKLA